MSVIARCDICGNVFEGRNCNSRYCSVKCRKSAASEKARGKYQREQMRKNMPVKKRGMSLTEIAVAASKAGLTYGQYVSREGL